MLFHIFSLIDQIFLKDKYLISNIKKVKFLKNKSLIYFDINKIRISIDLNRRAKKRLRLIKLDASPWLNLIPNPLIYFFDHPVIYRIE